MDRMCKECAAAQAAPQEVTASSCGSCAEVTNSKLGFCGKCLLTVRLVCRVCDAGRPGERIADAAMQMLQAQICKSE